MDDETKGTARCSELLTDNLGHLYNGKYMDLLIKIIRKEKDIYALIKETLGVSSILLERTPYQEKITFKKEIKKGDLNYSLYTEIVESGIVVCGNFSQAEKETTTFSISFSKFEEKEKSELQMIAQTRTTHELTSTCIAGMLSVPTIKGLLEVERGRYLALITTGYENYYAMMENEHIGFITAYSKFSYQTPLFPGELYTIETFLPKKNMGKEVLRIPFYQEIRNKDGVCVATSENTMVKIEIEEKKAKKTFLKNL